jgi:uncharacterized cupin superfamily protein
MFFTSGNSPLPPAADLGSKSMQIGLADMDGWVSGNPDPTWTFHGKATTRSLTIASSADGCFTCSRWDCTDARFDLTYLCDEFVQILEGSVTIDDGKQTRTLGPGDVAYFPQGLRATWTVHGYVKKLAIFRSRPYGPLRHLASKVKRFVMRIFR